MGLSMLTWAANRVYGLIGLQIQSVRILLLCWRCCALWREHVVSLEENGLLVLDGVSHDRWDTGLGLLREGVLERKGLVMSTKRPIFILFCPLCKEPYASVTSSSSSTTKMQIK